jgi:hypothetical protein
MARTREQILEERRHLKKEYGDLFESVANLLFDADPIGINFEDNTDEYHPEVGTILPRLHSCRCADDVLRVTYEEFTRWFGAGTAGSAESYRQIASETWRLWSTRDGSELDSQL